jgi:Do/DeqQ family serine protease
MRQTAKNILGIGALVLLSAGVAGFTTYQMQRYEANKSVAFNDIFKTDQNARMTALQGTGQPVDLTQAAESSLHAVVHIQSTQQAKAQSVQQQAPSDLFDFFFGDGGRRMQQQQAQPKIGFGSGVIISTDGYIVTNNHVIDGADEITVKLNDNREFKGRIIGADANTDLALLKIEAKDDLPTIPVGDSDNLKVGEWVLAVGNPFNLNSTVTAGIVSAKARTLGVYNGGVESFIQTDAAINQGNSGGALVNAKGELVGINSVLSSPTGAYAGYGFAIPTSIMTKVISDLKQYGTVQRALLGIRGASLGGNLIDDQQVIDKSGTKISDKAKELGVVDGVWVNEVVEGGSAAAADIKVDDVIVGIDGKKVQNFADLQEALAKHRPGDKVTVKLVRAKKEKSVSVTLKNEQGNTKIVKEADMEILGAAFKELTDETKKQLNLGYGLQVTAVTAGKMKEAGVQKGFIILKANDQPMRSVSDLESALKAAVKSPDQVLYLSGVFQSGRRGYYAVDLTQE